MRRLNGLDTMFVSVESNRVPTHVTCVTIVDPATSREPYTLERIQESLAARLDLLAPFRRRLVEVPLGVGRPYWVEDPDFDLESHIRRTAVIPPGRTAAARRAGGAGTPMADTVSGPRARP